MFLCWLYFTKLDGPTLSIFTGQSLLIRWQQKPFRGKFFLNSLSSKYDSKSGKIFNFK